MFGYFEKKIIGSIEFDITSFSKNNRRYLCMVWINMHVHCSFLYVNVNGHEWMISCVILMKRDFYLSTKGMIYMYYIRKINAMRQMIIHVP